MGFVRSNWMNGYDGDGPEAKTPSEEENPRDPFSSRQPVGCMQSELIVIDFHENGTGADLDRDEWLEIDGIVSARLVDIN